MTIKRILVGTNFGASSQAALRYAVDLAAHFPASVGVVHVVQLRSRRPHTAVTETRRVRAAERRLRRSIPRVAGVPLGVDHEIRLGDPAAGIVAAAREQLADLIVLGTCPRTTVDHDTIRQVTAHAPCPVVLLPPATEGEEHTAAASHEGIRGPLAKFPARAHATRGNGADRRDQSDRPQVR